MKLPIDLIEAEGCYLGGQATVEKNDPVDLDHNRLLGEPTAVFSLAPKSPLASKIARWELFIEGGLHLLLRNALGESLEHVPSLLTFFGSFIFRKISVALRRHEAEVSNKVHEAVVSHQRVDSAASFFGLLLQPLQKIQDPSIVRPAIYQVSAEHDVIGSTRPLQLGVYDARALKDGSQLVHVCVHVSHRHDARDTVPFPLRNLLCSGFADMKEQKAEKKGEGNGHPPKKSSGSVGAHCNVMLAKLARRKQLRREWRGKDEGRTPPE